MSLFYLFPKFLRISDLFVGFDEVIDRFRVFLVNLKMPIISVFVFPANITEKTIVNKAFAKMKFKIVLTHT